MRSLIEFLAGNAVVLALLYFVGRDIGWREGGCRFTAYPFHCIAPVAPSANWFFAVTYQAVENQKVLTSPPTLNWPVVLLVALAAFDAFYAFRYARGLRKKAPPT